MITKNIREHSLVNWGAITQAFKHVWCQLHENISAYLWWSVIRPCDFLSFFWKYSIMLPLFLRRYLALQYKNIMFCSRSRGPLTLNAILQITVWWLWNTATFPVRKMRTSFLSLQTLRISYPSLPPMWPAFEECEFQPSLNISKPMLDIVKLRIFLSCTLMSMKWPRYISWHPRRTLKLLFDLRKARRRSIMHSATHAGQFLSRDSGRYWHWIYWW